MSSNERPSVSTVPAQGGESHTLNKVEKRHRSSRGRRSSIKVAVEGSSPVTIVAPLPDSILNNTAVDQETQLIQRRDCIVSYIARLQFEKEEWKERYEKQKLLMQLAKRDSGRPFERGNRIRLSIIDSMPVRSTVNRVLRTFHDLTGSLPDQDAVDKLQREAETMEDSIGILKSKAEKFTAFLNAEPRSELISQKKWWEDLKSKLLRRRKLLEERLAYLESLESVPEENSFVDIA